MTQEQAKQTVVHPAMPCIVIRGLPNSGKTTLANQVVKMLRADKHQVFHINADVMRASLNSDLGFDIASRVENARRMGAVALIAATNGMIPVIDFVMPTEETLEAFRKGFNGGIFSLWCIKRERGFMSRFADTQNIFDGVMGKELSYKLNQLEETAWHVIEETKSVTRF